MRPGAEAPGETLQFVLREAAPDDAEGIDAVMREAFGEPALGGPTAHGLVCGLRDAGALALSLVATQEGGILGHLAFTPVTIDGLESGWWALGPLAVKPSRQRMGIGSALVRSGLRRLRGRGVPGCVVLGDPAWHGRFGFAPAAGLVCPGAPPGHCLALALEGPAVSGLVACHPAFGAQGPDPRTWGAPAADTGR